MIGACAFMKEDMNKIKKTNFIFLHKQKTRNYFLALWYSLKSSNSFAKFFIVEEMTTL